MLGDTSVGKSSLVSQFVKRQMPMTPAPTIGIEFITKAVTLINGNSVKAHIWDTGT